MASRLADLGADAAVHDAARVTRLPFSINSKTGRLVLYYPQQDATGRIPTYTLSQLSAYFGLAQTTTLTVAVHIPTVQASTGIKEPYKRATHSDPQRSEWGRQGQKARFEKELAGLRSLEQLRGGFSKGQRSNAVFAQSVLLRFLRQDQREIETQALALGLRCHPPLAENRCLEMAAATHINKYTRFPWTRRKIFHCLSVTAIEQSQIANWKPRQKRCPSNSERKTNERRALAVRATQERGPMSLSEMQSYLLARGHIVSRQTISRDYALSGMSQAPRKAGEKTQIKRTPPPPYVRVPC